MKKLTTRGSRGEEGATVDAIAPGGGGPSRDARSKTKHEGSKTSFRRLPHFPGWRTHNVTKKFVVMLNLIGWILQRTVYYFIQIEKFALKRRFQTVAASGCFGFVVPSAPQLCPKEVIMHQEAPRNTDSRRNGAA